MSAVHPELQLRREDGHELSLLVWRFAEPKLVISSAACGGGLGLRAWVVNAQVVRGYTRTDLDAHARELAGFVAAAGDGVTMLTAVDVRRAVSADEGGVSVTATVGVTHPVWAAEPHSDVVVTPGTINVVVQLPVAIAAGGMVNLVATVTEAKVQALAEAGIQGTGTPSDAVTVVCATDGVAEPFGGPRSLWGARVARAVHRTVAAGLTDGQ